MSLSAVFLDLGGTLLTERTSRAQIYAAEARAAGLAVSPAEMEALMAESHAALPRDLEGAFRYSDAWFRAFQQRIFVQRLGLAAEGLAPLSDRLFARFEDASTFVLYPGARDLPRTLRRHGLRVGLVTNWSARVQTLLNAVGLGDAFDFVLCSASARLEKPDPAIFAEAARRAGFPPGRCLHAGDREDKDARGALSAGLAAILVDHSPGAGERVGLPCRVARSLAQLEGIILERSA
jgi:putative hydrolase of the HAD superfamily